MKKIFLACFFGIVIISGCVQSLQTNESQKPTEQIEAFNGETDLENQVDNTLTNTVEDYKAIKDYEIVGEWTDFKNPLAIAIDSKDNIYVSEFYTKSTDNARILKFDKDFKKLGWFGKGNKTTGWHETDSDEISLPGFGDAEFFGVGDIVFDSLDNMFVLDGGFLNSETKEEGGNHRIQKFDNEGNFLGWIGKGDKTTGWHEPNSGETSQSGTDDGAFRFPTGLLVLDDGTILVGGGRNYRVDKFSFSGEYLGWLGKASDESYGWHSPGSGIAIEGLFFGNEIGAFQAPIGLAINNENQFYVIDYNNDPVVSVFDFESGDFLWGIYHGEGYKPDNIILDKYSNIILTDVDQGSVKMLDREGTKKATMQLGPPDYLGAAGFALDSEGFLYFTEYSKNKVVKVKLIYE